MLRAAIETVIGPRPSESRTGDSSMPRTVRVPAGAPVGDHSSSDVVPVRESTATMRPDPTPLALPLGLRQLPRRAIRDVDQRGRRIVKHAVDAEHL